MGKSVQLTRFELEIMDRIWALGECSVRNVLEAIGEDERPAYTTVLTIFQRLEHKGAVRRTRKVGNASLYEAAITRRSAYRRLLDELVTVFGGSQPLLTHLVESGKLSLADLKAVERVLSDANSSHIGKPNRRGGGHE